LVQASRRQADPSRLEPVEMGFRPRHRAPGSQLKRGPLRGQPGSQRRIDQEVLHRSKAVRNPPTRNSEEPNSSRGSDPSRNSANRDRRRRRRRAGSPGPDRPLRDRERGPARVRHSRPARPDRRASGARVLAARRADGGHEPVGGPRREPARDRAGGWLERPGANAQGRPGARPAGSVGVRRERARSLARLDEGQRTHLLFSSLTSR
jgi:hypothetical protein